ncbi:MAG: CBS domain-containing protein [Methanobrevibacter sp.]|jgi:IMP dehydrogenase|nr:CBS domain-containing protein [Candidatus Methanoflexus mossambicus]
MSNEVIKKSFVQEYMSTDVISVKEDDLVEKVFNLMKDTKHDGFPVVDDENKVVGIITAFDLLLKKKAIYVKEIMTSDVITAQENMSTDNASRVMFRKAISRLPVIDKKDHLIGIITNTDLVRSHIERTTPTKLEMFKSNLEQIYQTKIVIKHEKIDPNKIRPTQDKIYKDELEGRTYELEKGLAEPAIVARVRDRYVLVDGHHRVAASIKLGLKEIDSYVLEIKDNIVLGLEKTADKMNVYTFDDIQMLESQHELIAITEKLLKK